MSIASVGRVRFALNAVVVVPHHSRPCLNSHNVLYGKSRGFMCDNNTLASGPTVAHGLITISCGQLALALRALMPAATSALGPALVLLAILSWIQDGAPLLKSLVTTSRSAT